MDLERPKPTQPLQGIPVPLAHGPPRLDKLADILPQQLSPKELYDRA